jgi:hypothetical protein
MTLESSLPTLDFRIIASETAERPKSALRQHQVRKNFSDCRAKHLVSFSVTSADAAR